MNLSAISGPEDLKNRRVTVMGLGRFGGAIAAVRYLVDQEAFVTVTDKLPNERLQESLQQIADLPLCNVFCGEHPPEAFENCELLLVNPAVKPDHPILQHCTQAGIPVMTEIQLLMLHLGALSLQLRDTSSDPNAVPNADVISKTANQLPPASGPTVVAVTGTNGKSTTAALIHHFLTSEFEAEQNSASSDQSIAKRKCWLGGNIGGSLLDDVNSIAASDVVVLELSSFQLHYLQDFAFAPDVAVLTGFSANHLNWHPNLQHYHAAKQNLFRRQTLQQAAVLPESHITNGQRLFSPEHDDQDQPTWRIRGCELRFGTVDDGLDGVYWEENWLVVRRHGVEDAVRISLPSSLSGQHSLHNLTAAACAAVQVGADPMRFPRSVLKFLGLPYRLAISGQKDSVQMVNDSASTTPESTIAAIQTLRHRVDHQMSKSAAVSKARLVVIVGGAEKGSDLLELAKQLKQSADAVVAIGDVADGLAALMSEQSGFGCENVVVADDFFAAFGQAVELVASAGIVLLSPGCSSFGWFRDYVDRGQQFDSLVEEWMQR